MATPIIVDNVNYYGDFSGGQGAGASNYFNYAPHMDTNFGTLLTKVNQLVAEVSSVSGPNAVVSLDILQFDDPTGTIGIETDGVIGEHSFRVTINGGDAAQLDVKRGKAILAANRLEITVDQFVTGSGGSGTYYIALDGSGNPSVEAAADLQIIDIASAVWNGTIFTSVTQIAEIFIDGEAWRKMRNRGVLDAFTVAKLYRDPSERIVAIERLLSGLNTDADGIAIGPILIPGGSAAAPGLIFGDGTSAVDDIDTGFYRAATNVIGFSSNGSDVFRIGPAQLRMINGTAGTPVITANADVNTGIYFDGADLMGFSSAGAAVASVLAAQFRLHAAGALATPQIAFASDLNTGFFFEGSDILSIVTNSLRRIAIDATGIVDLPTNARAKANRASQTIATGTGVTAVAFSDADSFDTQTMHDTSTNNDRVTIPTGGDGLYMVKASCTWDEAGGASSNVGDRELSISIEGTIEASDRKQSTVGGDTDQFVGGDFELSAGEVVRAHVAQDSTSNMDCIDIVLSVVKVA